MLINKAEYLISAVAVKQFPHPELPQFLLMGRSNVGKSSFINALTNRKNLAFTSSKPGKTETLNFYLCNDKMMFVDAPGYGYAKKAKEKRVDFGSLLERYLNSDVNISGVFHIIDIRHDPTEDDQLVFDFLQQFEIPIYVIATKADKLSKNQVAHNLKRVKDVLKMSKEDIAIVVSSETRQGLELVYDYLIQELS